MARSTHQNSEDSEKSIEKLTNGFGCHNGHSTSPSYCSHSSKRKKLQKPKAVSGERSVGDILKNGDVTPQQPDKVVVKPCRRSERKIMPSSLWDNAVINPFFERKRRKLSESPVKIKLSTDHDNSINDGDLNKFDNSINMVSNGDLLNPNPVNQTSVSPEVEDASTIDSQGHVRLRRSSRKHSSSISSISDTKYTIKHEHIQKFSQNSFPDNNCSADTSSSDYLDTSTLYIEAQIVNDESPMDVDSEVRGAASSSNHSGNSSSRHEFSLKKEESASAILCKPNTEQNSFNILVSPITSGLRNRRRKILEDFGCVENIPPTSTESEHVKGCEQEYKSLGSNLNISSRESSEEIFYTDSLGRRGRKRGRKARPRAVPSGTQTPDNEITVSKEALSLIDGSSFQRFYKMRTRCQNSSNEESSERGKDTDSRWLSRSNSGNSKHSGEDTPAGSAGDLKKRTKRVKPDILCSFCLQTSAERREEMISCFLCGASGHPSCLQFDGALTQRVKLYEWECIECKKCELCRNSGDDATLLFCDDCDKGFHMGCLKPALSGEPIGHWSCLYCVEGSTYWDNKVLKCSSALKQHKRKRSDKVSKRKQLLDDLAMFHEAQSRAQKAMAEELKLQPKLKTQKKRNDGKVPPIIKSIEFGCYEVTTWYTSPYPAEYALQTKLYICEFCLKYMKSGVIANRHTAKCPARCPPGDEIYRKDTVSVFEVDGRKNKTYCQNLCLLAKLFLDHKTLYYDVEPFLFYMLTEYDKKGCHVVGYFSKEKNSFLCHNVSCILVLPPYMKKGYGKMLIDFSYALSRKEGKLGSPEKPLSDLGLISYRNYWKEKLLEYFLTYNSQELTIKDISQTLGFNPYDIVSTLQAYGMIKYHKSNHYVLKRPEMLSAFKRKQNVHANLPTRSIDMTCLKWTPPCQRV